MAKQSVTFEPERADQLRLMLDEDLESFVRGAIRDYLKLSPEQQDRVIAARGDKTVIRKPTPEPTAPGIPAGGQQVTLNIPHELHHELRSPSGDLYDHIRAALDIGARAALEE
jgi:hypothetical protein